MSRNQLESLRKAYDKRIVYAPKKLWETTIENQLKEWGLPDPESITSTDILHSVNFHAMMRVYSKSKKHFLLKIVLNECGLDINEPSNGEYELQIVDIERARESLPFLAEKAPIKYKRSRLKEVDDEFKEVEQAVSSMETEEVHSTEEVMESDTVKTE